MNHTRVIDYSTFVRIVDSVFAKVYSSADSETLESVRTATYVMVDAATDMLCLVISESVDRAAGTRS